MSADTQTVTIRLGEDVVLKPSAAAAAAISRQFGGISAGFERIGRCEVDAIAFVIAAGTGKYDAKAMKDITSKIFDAGIASLISPTAQYLGLLLNGGRPADEQTEEPAAVEPSAE